MAKVWVWLAPNRWLTVDIESADKH